MSGATNAGSASTVQSFRYQTSEQGSVIPICYGWNRVTPNLIEAFGVSASGGGKGGKGGGVSGGKGKADNAQYSAYVAFAICQGPIAGINGAWVSQGVEAFSQTGLSLYAGGDGQAPDPTFASVDTNSPVLGYSGTCYVTGAPLQLGSAPALPNYSFEVQGLLAGSNGNYLQDTNPADIVSDFLTNPRYGAGFPAASLDAASLADFGNYCAAISLFMAPIIDSQQDAGQYLSDIAAIANTAIVWSGSRLKFVPYGDTIATGNGITWTPNLVPAYALSDDDFIPWQSGEHGGGGDDPVIVTRINPADATNWLSLEFADRGNYYDYAIAAVFDQGAIDQYGLRMEPSIATHGICQQGIAVIAATLLLQRRQYIRNTYKFQLGWQFCLLEPMDIVLLTDTGLGLADAPVRITSIAENDNGDLTIEAEEIPGITPERENLPMPLPPIQPIGVGTAVPRPSQAWTATLINRLVAPGNTNPPVVFEPPPGLTNGINEIWVAAAGGIDWGGCQVWVSTDGTTYGLVGTIYAGAVTGRLTATVAAGGDPDTGDTIALDLGESRGQLLSGTRADADNFVTLCYVDGELVAYQTATLTGVSRYTLGTYLRRGCYGTAIGQHGNGSQFARLNGAVFRYPYPASFVGQALYLKLPAFNIYGQALQDLSAVGDTFYPTTGAGTSPLDNPLLAALAAGTATDWGIAGSSLIGSADFAPIDIATGLAITLGTLS